MAKIMKFTDEFNETHEESYWKLVQENIGWADRSAHVVFYGYPRAGSKRVIGQKVYDISGDLFDRVVSQYEAMNPRPDVREFAYLLATNLKDVLAPTEEEPDRKVSFFENATDDVEQPPAPQPAPAARAQEGVARRARPAR